MDDKNLMAQASQRAYDEAKNAEPESLPEPPQGYPALESIPDCQVLGYIVKKTEIKDCFGPDGKIKRAGDSGFLEAQYGRLGFNPMPDGWRFETRTTSKLFAIVAGSCPIKLEPIARAKGYPAALAVAPNLIDLGEITLD